jgi:hypothetical protein
VKKKMKARKKNHRLRKKEKEKKEPKKKLKPQLRKSRSPSMLTWTEILMMISLLLKLRTK